VVAIEFGQYVAGDNFEWLVSEALKDHSTTAQHPRVCVLDFRETNWIDIVSTQTITAFVIAVRKRNWLTIVRPPQNKEARDFWRLWRFPEAFEAATQIPFSRLVAGKDRDYLKEPQTTYSDTSVLRIHDPLDEQAARSLNFFGFVSDTISGSNLANIASSQADKWTGSDVQDVLEKYVGGRCDYIPTRIVFEAVFNATKHPGATLIQSASYHNKFTQKSGSKERSRDSDFVVFFWDNGRSMLSTVNSALGSGVDLKRHYLEEFEKRYHVLYSKQHSTEKYEDVISSSMEISSDLPDEIKILSTLFPGVSTKPDAGFVHEVHPEVEKFDERFGRRGMGLFVLVNAVVEVLNGSVSFRAGRYYMHVSKHKPRTAEKIGAPLKVIIVEMLDALPEFEGNLITVRLPTEKKPNENVGVADSL
jgi:hypothetical protein